jgi:predicted flap endonuclease-1-like 5' DNA nuclease
MYSWRARQCCDSPGLADTGGKLLTALRKSSTVWRQVATDADRSPPLLPVAIRCQAVDCARENASTVWRQVANHKIHDVEGVGPVRREKFLAAGIKDTDGLLKSTKTPKQRKNLAEKTGISVKWILKFANMADLFRVPGIGSEYSQLLEASGVDTVIELSTRIPKNLHTKVSEVNIEKKNTRQPPSLAEITSWIEEAKKLPRFLEY